MNTTDQILDQLARGVNSLRDDLERLVRLAQFGEEDDDSAWLRANGEDLGIYDHEGLWSHLWELPLEVIHRATRHNDGDNWEYTNTVVVFCAGGPHIELDTATRTISGRWGGYSVDRSVDRSVAEFYALED